MRPDPIPERRFEVLLALGSNIEPAHHVPLALQQLDARFDVRAVSAPFVSAAHGAQNSQPEFVNLAVRLRTDLPHRALRVACRWIEAVCGRRRTADRTAPRTMDIDIVFGDPAFTATAGDAVPAGDLLIRAYVLQPCAEVWPAAIHPDTGRRLLDHAGEFHKGV